MAWTVIDFKELRALVIILPPVLNADYEAIVLTRMDKRSQAIFASSEYLMELYSKNPRHPNPQSNL